MPLNTVMRLDLPFVPSDEVAATTASALAALWTVMEAPHLLTAHRRELMSVAVWKYTEAPAAGPHAKYRLPYRSVAAMDMTTPASVQHEHVWPRRWIIDRLLRQHAAGGSPHDLARLMRAHAVACTVTEGEHVRLNAHAELEGWARYAAAGIVVWDLVHDQAHAVPGNVPAPDVAAPPAPPRREVAGVVDDEIAAILAANRHRWAPLVRQFTEQAMLEDVDLIPHHPRNGSPGSYLRVHAAGPGEASAALLYINLNGALDFRLTPLDLPELMTLPGVAPRASAQYGVRCSLSDQSTVTSGLQILYEVLERARAA